MGHDRTDAFRDAFKAASDALTPLELDKRRLAFRRLRPVRRPTNPFADRMSLVESNATKAIEEAKQCIINAIAAIDNVTTSSSAREVVSTQLMISDVELQAVGALVKKLQGEVEETEKQLAERAKGGEGRQLMEHVYNALAVLGERIGKRRVAVAVAREEVDRHRTLLVKLSKAGVLAWPTDSTSHHPTKASLLQARGDERSLRAASSTSASGKGGDGKAHAASAAVKHLANATSAGVLAFTRNIAAASKAGTSTLTAAPADESRRTTVGGASWAAADLDESVRNMDADRREMLHQEHQQLELAQRQSAAAAAREVEATVRDLSILTAIMNEQVALQAEKLVLVERDTSRSQVNLSKAAVELRKPAQEVWTPDRILAAVLFCCSLLLLLLNALIR